MKLTIEDIEQGRCSIEDLSALLRRRDASMLQRRLIENDEYSYFGGTKGGSMAESTVLGGTKHDQGKPRMDLLPKELLEEVAKVLTFGAEKYDAHNWRGGMDWSRLIGACQRHLIAWNDGEDTDEESGLSHLAHAGCCIAFLLTYQATETGNDDRYRS